MSTHLKECAKYKAKKQTQNGSNSTGIRAFFEGDAANTGSKNIKVSQEFVEETILKFFVSNNIPFKAADNEYFRKLVSLIALDQNSSKNANCLSRNIIRARLSKYSKMGRDQFKHVLSENDSKFNIALDCWSSRNNYGFMGLFISIRELILLAVICHWISSNWTLEEALLHFSHIPGHHTGAALGKEVIEILEEYGIIEKLFCVTTDNASNNTEMMKHIGRYLRKEYNIIWKSDEHHIACLNHVINLAVKDFLKEIKGLNSEESSDEHPKEDEDDEEKISEGFDRTFWKIRTIAKVNILILKVILIIENQQQQSSSRTI